MNRDDIQSKYGSEISDADGAQLLEWETYIDSHMLEHATNEEQLQSVRSQIKALEAATKPPPPEIAAMAAIDERMQEKRHSENAINSHIGRLEREIANNGRATLAGLFRQLFDIPGKPTPEQSERLSKLQSKLQKIERAWQEELKRYRELERSRTVCEYQENVANLRELRAERSRLIAKVKEYKAVVANVTTKTRELTSEARELASKAEAKAQIHALVKTIKAKGARII